MFIKACPIRIVLTLICICLLNSCTEKPSSSGVPKMMISLESTPLNFEERLPCTVNYYDRDSQIVCSEVKSAIRYRGNMAGSFEKKSFSLKISQEIAPDGLDSSRVWILNAEYVDKTFIRNKLSYDLYRAFTPGNFAPEIIYTELYINEEYQGLYTITERTDIERLSINTADKKAVLFKEPPIFVSPEKHEKGKTDLANYLKQNSRFKDFKPENLEELLSECYYNQRYPKRVTENRESEIDSISSFLFNSSDSLFMDSISGVPALFNLDNIIDWHLLLLITNNSDGILKNYYLYREGKDQVYRICPWDYDHSFGRDGDGELNPDGFIDCNVSVLIKRLLELNAFNYRERLRSKYYQLKEEGVLTVASLHKAIDEHNHHLKPYILRNNTLWPIEDYRCPISGNAYFNDSNFENEISLMKTWLRNQLPKVEQYLDQLDQNN